MKTYILICLLFLFVLPACGKSSKAKNREEAVYQDYGKPGPAGGVSCYVGPAKGEHSCMEVNPADKDGVELFTKYCVKHRGQAARGSCTMDQYVATCRYMTGMPSLSLRFYSQAWLTAKEVCNGENGVLESAW